MQHFAHSRGVFGALLGALLTCALLALAAPAVAQSTVVVLGIRSLEGDDDFARNLSGAVRSAASQVAAWQLSEREVTLAQAALAHGCEEPEPTCLQQMAGSLRTQRIVYGDVRRTSAGSGFDWSVSLHIFDAEAGRIEHSAEEVIPGVRRDIDELREPARRIVATLSGAPRVGTLRISANVPGAEVRVDDEAVGVADAQGELVVPSVPAGSRAIRVVAPGHEGFRSTVEVEAHGETGVEAALVASAGAPSSAAAGGSSLPVEMITGAALLVVAAGLAAGWIGSWAHVQGLQNDPDFAEYRRGAGDYVAATQGPGADPSQIDVCTLGAPDNFNLVYEGITYARGRSGRAIAVCNEASTYEALQFVFGIGAAAAAGVGLYFLISALTGDSTPPERQSFRLTPSVGPEHGYLGAQLSF